MLISLRHLIIPPQLQQQKLHLQFQNQRNDKSINNKLKNDPFGDNLKNETTDSIQILFQNVNGLELSTTGHTLEEICDSI